MDLWLARLSNFSQFGLFALTVGTLYFTVIPLYKMAALEELIAKREAQLAEAEHKVIAAQKNLDTLTREVYVRERYELIRKFVFGAGAECSGLMKQPDFDFDGPPLAPEDKYLIINVRDCLLSEFESFKIEQKLDRADSSRLRSALVSIGANLEKGRIEARKKILEVPGFIDSSPDLIAPMGPAERSWIKSQAELKKIFPGEDWKKVERDLAIDRTQLKIASKFEEVVRDEVARLLDGIEIPVRALPRAG
ncbi:hypothetical protein [Pseudomonas citronellolis]|uniref:hypothetical protein n=1 Tax=Pseudomonas citronellolis TaxID=53408 RepID=UPI0020A1D32C|nr:hypothetical protein [Pseudomonas citronellolis]MCP1608294.1 hypothetical protein [Pseudomonas citronellolis]MCP1659029.1 hypothetical protein [Pseudomonas citronellolis]MCP1725978.1 hypothetical protein [Pseudomonas citronellolis]